MRLWLFLICIPPAAAFTQSAPTSLVNVTDARFAQGCPAAADPLGKQDSTCAIRAALHFVQTSGIPGAGFPVLYFPHGSYKVAGEGYTSAFTITKSISIQGDGSANTVLVNTSARAATLTYLEASGCSDKPGACPLTVSGLTFAGQGHGTAGGLVEIDSSNTGSMHDVAFAGTGGIALNLQGSSERWYFSDMEFLNARWPVLLEGDTNETYFNRVNVLNGGEAGDGYCYSINCPGGKRIERGVWRPDPHSAVYLEGDNVHWENSSIKSTHAIGGIRMATVTSSLMHTYIEGYPWGGQPRFNHAVAAPGKSELGHLTQAIDTSTLDIPVDDAPWQPLYVNDPAQARINGPHSYVSTYGIFPADYLPGSTAPSLTVPGITRGTLELVQVGAFSGDGQGHLLKRGPRPVAWPAGSVIEQAAPNGYGSVRLEENHFNSLGASFDAGRYSSGCSDTEQQKNWTDNPSTLCAEVIAGLVPDGFMVPFPAQDYVHNSFTIEDVSNSIFTGGEEREGEGWIKIPGNATVSIDAANEPMRSFVDAGTALHSYSNGAARVEVVRWPVASGGKPASALAYVVDASAGVRFSPQEGFYTADVMRDGSLQHQYLGTECWYNMAAGSAAPDRRACAAAANGGLQQSVLANGRWTAAAAGTVPSSNGAKYVLRDWQVNTLAPRGQAEDCKSRTTATGGVRFSTAGDATLIVNVQPNPGALVMASASVGQAGEQVTVRLCNTGGEPVRWTDAPMVTLTQLP